MKLRLSALALLSATAGCTTSGALAPQPVQLGVASFNMAWAGTEADFQSHLAMCTAVEWCDTRPRRNRGETTPSPEAIATAKRCEAAIDQFAGGARQAMQIAPCNAYKSRNTADVTLANYQKKLAGLRATIANLIEKDGVQVIAFQEVKSGQAVRDVLGKHAATFDVCFAPHNAFQTVAFAWNKAATQQPGQCASRTELAVPDDPANAANFRTLRPGLALELTVNGQPLTFMNVHLKSACANLKPNGPFQPRKLDDADAACRVLNRQVPALEDWIEAVDAKSPRFVLLGDFNRRIDEEAAETVPPSQVRTDGSDPAGPNRKDALGYVATKYLWQEISDGKPTLFQVPLSGADSGCKGFTGLDHIVVSQALKAMQPDTAFGSRKVPVVNEPGQAIETSDHCPRIMTLTL
jgi:endonuclease/exonuclease/phosphatase family metal-dependent hydrolase